MSVCPPVLLFFISRRVFYLIWYFVVRLTVYNCLPCVLPLLVLASVRLLQVFGRVFGCYESLAVCSAIRSVWPCVRLLEVFGRVFGCYKCLAVCSAVSSIWPCVRLLEVFGRVFGCYNFLAVCSAVTIVGRAFGRFKCWSASVLLFSSCFYLYAFLPVSGFAHSFYLSRLLFSSWDLPFCLGMSYLTLMYFLGRFKVLPIFLLLFGSLYAFTFPLHSLRAYSALFWS